MRAAGILFDKDGTLFDFDATYAPACAAVVRDLARDEVLAADMAAAVGFDLAAVRFLPGSIVIAGTARDMARLWGPYLGIAHDLALEGRIDALFERHTRLSVTLFAGVPEILSRLSASGLRLGIATNDAEANARAHAGAAGIDGLMEFVAGYDSGHGAKPSPGMIAAFARHCGVETSRIVMVGDSRHDLVAARAAGAFAVAVTTGPATREELAPHADATIDSLAGLIELPPLCPTGSAAR